MRMSFNAKAIFGNLAEQEKIKGHHSPEVRAIRTLSRALSGWSSGNLSAGDTVVLCDQAMEEWLKTRLRLSPWSPKVLTELLVDAVTIQLVACDDAGKLERLHRQHSSIGSVPMSATDAEETLKFCIDIVEKRW